MKKSLRTHCLSVMTAMSVIPAAAQVETFMAPVAEVDGVKIEKRFFVNWENGFSGEIENIIPGMPEMGSYLKIGNPIVMASLQNELGNQTIMMAQALKDIEAKSVAAADMFDKLYEATDNINNSYLADIENLTNAYLKMLDTYESMGEHIEKKLSNINTKSTRTSSFYIGLSSIISDWDYSVFKVNFTYEYLNDLSEEIIETTESLEEETDEAVALINLYTLQAETALATLSTLSEYYETYQDDLSYSQLVDLHEMIIENIKLIEEVVKGYELKPFDYTYLLLSHCLQSLESVKANYLEAVEEVENLYSSLCQLPDLTTTLYRGLENEPFGLAYNIIGNDGALVIPSEQSDLEETFVVSEIIGYVFGPCYDRENPICRKVVIPKSISSIKNEAFAAPGIETVVCEANANDEYVVFLSDDSFTAEVYQNAILYVPEESMEYYAKAPGWKNFKNIMAISDSGVETEIADNLSIRIEGGNIIMDGTDGILKSIYSTTGMKVYEGYDSSVSLTIPGLYVINIGAKSYKIII